MPSSPSLPRRVIAFFVLPLLLAASFLVAPAPAWALGRFVSDRGDPVPVAVTRAIVVGPPSPALAEGPRAVVIVRFQIDGTPPPAVRWISPEGTGSVRPVLGDPFAEIDALHDAGSYLLFDPLDLATVEIAAPVRVSTAPGSGVFRVEFEPGPSGWVGDLAVEVRDAPAAVARRIAEEAGAVVLDAWPPLDIPPFPLLSRREIPAARTERLPPAGIPFPSLHATTGWIVLDPPVRLAGLGGPALTVEAALGGNDRRARRAAIDACRGSPPRANALLSVLRLAVPLDDRRAALEAIVPDPRQGGIGRLLAGVTEDALAALLDGIDPSFPPDLMLAVARRMPRGIGPGGLQISAERLAERLAPALATPEVAPSAAALVVAMARLVGAAMPVGRQSHPAGRATLLWQDVALGMADLGGFRDLATADPAGPAAAIAMLAGPDPSEGAAAPPPAYALAVLRVGRSRSDAYALRAAHLLLGWAEAGTAAYLGTPAEIRREARSVLDRLATGSDPDLAREAQAEVVFRFLAADLDLATFGSVLAGEPRLIARVVDDGGEDLLRSALEPVLSRSAVPDAARAAIWAIRRRLPDLAPALWSRTSGADRSLPGWVRNLCQRLTATLLLLGPWGDAVEAGLPALPENPAFWDAIRHGDRAGAARRLLPPVAGPDGRGEMVWCRALAAALRTDRGAVPIAQYVPSIDRLDEEPARILVLGALAETQGEGPFVERFAAEIARPEADGSEGVRARAVDEAVTRLLLAEPARAFRVIEEIPDVPLGPGVLGRVAASDAGRAALADALARTARPSFAARAALALPIGDAIDAAERLSPGSVRSAVADALGARYPDRAREIRERLAARQPSEADRVHRVYERAFELERRIDARSVAARYGYEAVLDYYRWVLGRDPDHANARYNLARLLQRLGRPEEAIRALEELTRLHPSNVEGWNSLGATHHRLGRLEEAVRCYQRAAAAATDPSQLARFQRNLGQAYRDLRRPDDAIAAYQASLAVQRRHRGALLGLGRALLDAGRPADAIGPLTEAAGIRETDGDDAWKDLARALRADGRYAEAAIELHLAMRNQESPRRQAYYRYLYVDMLLGDPIPDGPRIAESILAQAAPLAGDDPGLFARVAWMEARGGRPDAAHEHAVLALALARGQGATGSVDPLKDVGAILAQARLPEAVEAFDACLAARPGDLEALLGRAQALAATGRTDEAEVAIHGYLSAGGRAPAPAWYALAATRSLAGDVDGALDALDRAVDAGFSDAHRLILDPDLAGLHSKPRFLVLLDRIRASIRPGR